MFNSQRVVFGTGGNVSQSIDCYKQGTENGDRCALYHWNDINRYGMVGEPVNYDNNIDWRKLNVYYYYVINPLTV